MHIRRVLFALVMGAVSAVAAITPAQAASPTTQNGGGIYHCTSSAAHCTSSFASFDDGVGVAMYCWRDDRWATGNYSSNRWFFVRFGGGTEGYIHSSKVINQVPTPSCSELPRVHATQWAINRIGQSIYVNECLRFVQDAWAFAGNNIGPGGTAANYWHNYNGPRQTSSRPPRGALMFWDGRPGYPEGHVAISLGGGYAVSTYERSTVPVHIMSIDARNDQFGAYYLGWITP